MSAPGAGARREQCAPVERPDCGCHHHDTTLIMIIRLRAPETRALSMHGRAPCEREPPPLSGGRLRLPQATADIRAPDASPVDARGSLPDSYLCLCADGPAGTAAHGSPSSPWQRRSPSGLPLPRTAAEASWRGFANTGVPDVRASWPRRGPGRSGSSVFQE